MEKLTKENSLYLTIKQVYFDQIVEGTKTEEFREIKDTTFKKYLECDKDGNPYFDTELMKPDDPLAGEIFVWNNGVYPYVPKLNLKYLSLAVGYAKERDTAIVEVQGITFEPMESPKKRNVPARFHFDKDYNYVIDENGDLCLWIAVIHLGKVVEVHRK